MRKLRKDFLGLVLAVSAGLGTSAQAMDASDLVKMPDKRLFFRQADEMSFQDLRNLASTNQKMKQDVKDYFQHKKEVMENADCPVLTKKDLLVQLKDQIRLPLGTPDVLMPARAWNILKDSPIYTDATGLKWAYHEVEVPLIERMATMPDVVQGVKTIKTGQEGLWGHAELGSPKYGPMVVNSCTYEIGDLQPLEIYLVHEELKLD